MGVIEYGAVCCAAGAGGALGAAKCTVVGTVDVEDGITVGIVVGTDDDATLVVG